MVLVIAVFCCPFFILLRISVTDMGEQLNPFAPLIETHAGHFSLHLKLSHYVSLLLDPESGWGQTIYIEAYGLSLRYAFLTTCLCLFIGYPFAYFMARSHESIRPLLLLMVMLPFWTSFLLRVYAWKGLLADAGLINNLMVSVGLIDEPCNCSITIYLCWSV
jgi:putrescine transport system permease protein